MKLKLALLIVAALLITVGAARAQEHESRQLKSSSAKTSSLRLGDKVIAIPEPEGFEEATSQFKVIKDRFEATEPPSADMLLVHLPAEQCQLLRKGGEIEFSHYTKISILKLLREQPVGESVMTDAITEFRKNGAAIMDPKGSNLKQVMEHAEEGLSKLESRRIGIDLAETQILGEIDVRSNVYTVLLLMTFKFESQGQQSVRPMLASLSFVRVKHRFLYVTVYHKFESTAVLKAQLKPGMEALTQFTAKWINEILAANPEG